MSDSLLVTQLFNTNCIAHPLGPPPPRTSTDRTLRTPSGIFLTTHIKYVFMSKHHPDLIMCRKQPGIAIGRVCEKCDGKCVICDSYVRPVTLVRICDECNYGSFQGRCVVCGSPGVSDAYYCANCTRGEKDRDGCPKIVNLGSSKTDLFYERKKFGFKKR
ncbi:PHD finger-like domain-containing protein 5A [Linnemannia elongata]|nr:PHD finger-like domain-containing protein 5A [Linnemannia elongata]